MNAKQTKQITRRNLAYLFGAARVHVRALVCDPSDCVRREEVCQSLRQLVSFGTNVQYASITTGGASLAWWASQQLCDLVEAYATGKHIRIAMIADSIEYRETKLQEAIRNAS